jgi:hypothetical protein
LRYTIDVEADVLKRVEIWKGTSGIIDQRAGVIEFAWIQESSALSHDSDGMPDTRSTDTAERAPGILWPVMLLDTREEETPKAVADGTPPPTVLEGDLYDARQP